MNETAILGMLGTLAMVELFVYGRLLSHLKSKHKKSWIDLGSPSLIMNNSIANNLLVLKFIFKRKFLKIEDKKLHKLGNTVFVFSFIWFFVIFMVFFCFLF